MHALDVFVGIRSSCLGGRNGLGLGMASLAGSSADRGYIVLPSARPANSTKRLRLMFSFLCACRRRFGAVECSVHAAACCVVNFRTHVPDSFHSVNH